MQIISSIIIFKVAKEFHILVTNNDTNSVINAWKSAALNMKTNE